jgi:hypothetical protein
MREVVAEESLARLLAEYETRGGRIDFVFLEADAAVSGDALHRAAALEGMAAIDRRLEQHAIRHASEEYPVEQFFRVTADEAMLEGAHVTLSDFWGTDNVEFQQISDRAWSIPPIDGYKPAFFHPPYGLAGGVSDNLALFDEINRHVLGGDPQRAEIWVWSTNWSNYFDAGHEWWGAFYWTVRAAGGQRVCVIAASATD